MSKATNKIGKAGDVRIEDITIITLNGFAQTITPQVIGVEIFEDIFSTFITGKLVIRDSQELTNLLPLVGEEIVRIRILTPSLPESDGYIGEYFIYKLDDRVQVKEREVVYVLHFISKEAVTDLNRKVSKAYSGKVSDIVSKLIKDQDSLASTKPVNIEPTKNTTKFVANFWTPTKCLQYCSDTAVNANDSPSYLFFENKHGLNFVTLETLYSGTPLYQRFVWDNYSAEIKPTGSSGLDIEKDYQRVLEFQTPESFDYMKRLQSGMYGSEIMYYDILSQQYVHKGFTTEWDKEKHLNPYALYSDRVSARPKGLVMLDHKYYNNFDGYDDVTNAQYIQKRKALLAQAEGFKVTIHVHGRTDYSVGQRVRLEVPKNTHLKKDDPDYLDKITSGNYLIAAICHSISRASHECIIELIKDSFMVDLNAAK